MTSRKCLRVSARYAQMHVFPSSRGTYFFDQLVLPRQKLRVACDIVGRQFRQGCFRGCLGEFLSAQVLSGTRFEGEAPQKLVRIDRK